jgi:thymidylate synthase
LIYYGTTHEAYKATVAACLSGSHCRPRGQDILELEDYTFTVQFPSSEPIVVGIPERDASVARYTKREFSLYESGERSSAVWAKGAPLWRTIQNPDGTVNSNYGYLLFHNHSCGKSRHANHEPITPWTWAYQALLQDRDTRQAFIRFSLPAHQWLGNRDQVCTMHGNFRIREGKLNLTIVMRSNDVIRGLAYDMPWFCSLLPRMRDELLHRYPDLQIGTYTHFAHSMHLYVENMALALQITENGNAYHAVA